MAEKQRSATLDYLVYIAVRILVCVLQAIPFSAACSFARFLGWVAYRVDKRHRRIAEENIAKSFPGRYTQAEIDQIVRGIYRHFSAMVIEILFMPRKVHVHNWKQMGDLTHGEHIIDGMLSGRPLWIVTGHHGNWELAGHVIGLGGFKTYAISRPLDNPYVQAFLHKIRVKTGQTILAKKGEYELIQGLLDQGAVIAVFADQDAGARGMFVDFFQRPASTHKSIALLALEHKAPMVVLTAPKINGKYQITSASTILPEDYSARPDAVRAMTQQFTSDLEKLICLAPEQYFWVHRRWKHQPAPRGKRKAA